MSLDKVMMNQYVFLFGATGGIGELLAKELSKRGFKVIGIGRKEEILKKMKEEGIIENYIVADVMEEKDLVKVSEEIKDYSKRFGKENVYVFYNQGIINEKTNLEEFSFRDIETSIKVNLESIIKLDSLIYKYVGGIGYMVSISAYSRGLWDPLYQTTKAGLKAYVESMSLRNGFPKVFLVSPDTIKTGEKGMGSKLKDYPKIPGELFVYDLGKEFITFVNGNNKYFEVIYEIGNDLKIRKYKLTENERDSETGRIPYERKIFVDIIGEAVY